MDGGGVTVATSAAARLGHVRFEVLPEPGTALDTAAKLGVGAVVLEFVRRLFNFARSKRVGEAQLTVSIVEDGAEIRRALIDENRRQHQEIVALLDRAHVAEKNLAVRDEQLARAIAERERVEKRLERKDGFAEALVDQLKALGKTPPAQPVDDSGSYPTLKS